MTDIQKIWNQTQKDLKQILAPAVYQTFIAKVQLTDIEGSTAKIACPNKYILDLNNKRYLTTIKTALNQASPLNLNPEFYLDPSLTKDHTPSPIENTPLFQPEAVNKAESFQHNLNPKFTFQNLVVGNSNNFAYAASQGILNAPGASYNPFFIWGGTGVGKTHLMHAIGHELIKKNPNLKIKYFPSETFTTDLYNALKTKNMTSFKDKYRSLDCILVDDIQFIAGKEYTQEEFFHTFNALHLAGKQIILTSDRKPSEIKELEDRLVSRFMGGLTVDIQLPDYEMRVAILRQKAEEKNIKITSEALSFLAENIPSSIRDLEGRLQDAAILAISKQQPEINLLTLSQDKPANPNFSTKANPRHIVSICAKTLNVKTGELCGKSRKKEIAQARHITAYILLTVANLPLQEVGHILGGRDHTSIMHARDKIHTSLSTNPQLNTLIHQITSSL